METPRPKQRPLTDFYAQLTSSTRIRKALKECFGDEFGPIVTAMRAETELAQEHVDAHDIIYELIKEKAKVVRRFVVEGSEAGEYPINIMQFACVYFIQASQFDDIEFFASADEAAEAITMNWFDAWEK